MNMQRKKKNLGRGERSLVRSNKQKASAPLLPTPSMRIQESVNVHSLEVADVLVPNPALRKPVVRY